MRVPARYLKVNSPRLSPYHQPPLPLVQMAGRSPRTSPPAPLPLRLPPRCQYHTTGPDPGKLRIIFCKRLLNISRFLFGYDTNEYLIGYTHGSVKCVQRPPAPPRPGPADPRPSPPAKPSATTSPSLRQADLADPTPHRTLPYAGTNMTDADELRGTVSTGRRRSKQAGRLVVAQHGSVEPTRASSPDGQAPGCASRDADVEDGRIRGQKASSYGESTRRAAACQ